MNQANDLSPSVESREQGGAWARGALLVLLVAVAFWPALRGEFVYDDEPHIERNAALRTTQGLSDIWLRWGAVPQYYPVAHSVFWLEFQLFGLRPWGYHAVNIALHALVAVLAWRLLERLQVPGAWWAAAIYAVHPVAVESVAWISELKNVLSMVFALGSLLAYLRFAPPDPTEPGNAPQPSSAAEPTGGSKGEPEPAPEGWWYETSLALYLAALLSKSVTVSVPAVLLLIYWWKRGRIAWRDVTLLAPFFLLGLVMSAITVWVEKTFIGAQGDAWDRSPLFRVLLAGRAVVFYACSVVWPGRLSFFYPRWQIDTAAAWQYAFPLGVLAALVALWLARGRIGRGPLAAALVFVGVLTPALGFLDVYPMQFLDVADHYQYHASLALVALLVAAAATLLAPLGSERAWAGAVAGGVVVAVLGSMTHRYARAFESPLTLYGHAIDAYPDAWVGHYNLAAVLKQRGHEAAAVRHFREVMRIVPREDWYRAVGPALMYAPDLDEAIAALEETLAEPLDDKRRARTHAYLANILSERQRHDEALRHYRAALELRPQEAQIHYGSALALMAAGQTDPALEAARRSLELDPGYYEGHHGLGLMLIKLGRPAEAIEPLGQAVLLRPVSAEYHEDLGAALLACGRLGDAESQLRRAVSLDPRRPMAHNLLGETLLRWGNRPAAVAEFEAALKIDPRLSAAALNLQRARGAK